MRSRRGYAVATVVLLLIEIAIALWVRDRVVRPFGGDAIAVMLVYCGFRAVTRWRWPFALAAALTVAVLVELGQLVGVLRLLGLADVPVARVVLGSGFDPRDFVAYALGGAVIAAIEWRRAR